MCSATILLVACSSSMVHGQRTRKDNGDDHDGEAAANAVLSLGCSSVSAAEQLDLFGPGCSRCGGELSFCSFACLLDCVLLHDGR